MEPVYIVPRPSRRLGAGIGQNESRDNGILILSRRHARGGYEWPIVCKDSSVAEQSLAVKADPTAGYDANRSSRHVCELHNTDRYDMNSADSVFMNKLLA